MEGVIQELLSEFKKDVPEGWWWREHNGAVHCCEKADGRNWLTVVSGDSFAGQRVFYAGVAPDPHEPAYVFSEEYETLEEAVAVYMSKRSRLKGTNG